MRSTLYKTDIDIDLPYRAATIWHAPPRASISGGRVLIQSGAKHLSLKASSLLLDCRSTSYSLRTPGQSDSEFARGLEHETGRSTPLYPWFIKRLCNLANAIQKATGFCINRVCYW
jgi:hypothetical protein